MLSFLVREADRQPSKLSKKGEEKGSVAMVKNVKKVGWRFLGYFADGRNINIAEGQKFFELQFASSVTRQTGYVL